MEHTILRAFPFSQPFFWSSKSKVMITNDLVAGIDTSVSRLQQCKGRFKRDLHADGTFFNR